MILFLLFFISRISAFVPYVPNYFINLNKSIQLNPFQILNSIQTSEHFSKTNLFSISKDDECFKKLGIMANHFMSDPALINLIHYSGKGLGDIGDYDGCESSNTSYYAIFTLQANVATGVRTAFCIPKECKAEHLDLTKPFIAEVASGVVQMKIKPEQVIFEYPKSENAVLNKIKPGGRAFLYVSYALIVFSLIITGLDRYGYFSKENPQSTTWKRIAVCFSVQRNLHQMFNTDNKLDNKLNVLNGIRVLSLCWIVMGHFTIALMISPILNFLELVNTGFHTYFMGFIKAGNLASDCFFFLSGFFASMTLYRTFKAPKNRTFKVLLWMYVRRYLRLLPIFLFGLLGTTYILPTMYDSPLSGWAGPQVNMCESQWYYCLSYINNFASGFYDSCMAWLWYIYVDMQFYLMMPVLFAIYFMSKKAMFTIIGVISIISLVVQILIIGHYKFSLSPAKLDNDNDLNTITFIKPYCRVWTYLMGIITYLMYEESKDEENGI